MARDMVKGENENDIESKINKPPFLLHVNFSPEI